MTPLKLATKQKTTPTHRVSVRIHLEDGLTTTVHVVRYDRSAYQTRLVVFEQATRLLDWCQAEQFAEALVGGFFIRETGRMLGDHWQDGQPLSTHPIPEPWNQLRGSLHITSDGQFTLGRRQQFPKQPVHSLLQAGPLLLQNRQSLITDGKEQEGVSAASHQFDTDITLGRYPRAAIGSDNRYIWSVVCDGRSADEAGLTLTELTAVMQALGAHDALNLDGGSSATQISQGVLRNQPRSDDTLFHAGRPVYSGLIFEPTAV